MTIKELENKIGGLEQQLKDRKEYNERVRKEFAKAFGWGEKDMYDREWKSDLPSWEQIFIHIGRLLANRRDLHYITDQEELKINVLELRNNIKSLENELNK